MGGSNTVCKKYFLPPPQNQKSTHQPTPPQPYTSLHTSILKQNTY